ncbi:MAG TPA: ATP-binding protein [Solirubrobacterales bacterium]|nr:ATP-binding protein [Solirubrobacterales bacterium]
MNIKREDRNPFLFGTLALDEAFTDREQEKDALAKDIRNGQDVVIFAPRRYGKSSLIWATMRALAEEGVLVAHVDLMTTPTKERLAAALASAVYEYVASPLDRVWEKASAPFRRLRVQPAMSLDPLTGMVGFSFAAAREPADIDATIEQLLMLPAELAADRGRRVALVFDEFQEVIGIDPHLPRLMRAVFQQQREVAHVYLGSKRHVMERIFSDRNEPFWRSAKAMELGLIPTEEFSGFLTARFEATRKEFDAAALAHLLTLTGGHPYATQQLAYFLWEETPEGGTASEERLSDALNAVLRSEHSYFTLLWDEASGVQRLVLQALAREPGHPQSTSYRDRHDLPSAASVQTALRALGQREIVIGEGGAYRIVLPFLAEWLRRYGR